MDRWELTQKQSLPTDAKVNFSKRRIRAWYEYWEGDVYISFSGGKDSTVLLHLVRSIYPNVVAVFVDTGLEFPEIRDFVKTVDNVVWVKPKFTFKEIIDKYGYPFPSKEQAQYIKEYRHTNSEKLKYTRWNGRPEKEGAAKRSGMISWKWRFLTEAPFEVSDKCCDYIKVNPSKQFEKETGLHPYLGNLADESNKRTQEYLKYGCNAFKAARPKSKPLSIWTVWDIWEYIKKNNLSYSKIYDMGYDNTGCMFCMFGVHLEKEPNRFQTMQTTHPVKYKYCIDKLGIGTVLDYAGVKYKS